MVVSGSSFKNWRDLFGVSFSLPILTDSNFNQTTTAHYFPAILLHIFFPYAHHRSITNADHWPRKKLSCSKTNIYYYYYCCCCKEIATEEKIWRRECERMCVHIMVQQRRFWRALKRDRERFQKLRCPIGPAAWKWTIFFHCGSDRG